MSEKKQKKKDGEDKNKDNQRMREATQNADKKNMASSRQDETSRGKAKQ